MCPNFHSLWRTYLNSYLSFHFISKGDKDNEILMCLILCYLLNFYAAHLVSLGNYPYHIVTDRPSLAAHYFYSFSLITTWPGNQQKCFFLKVILCSETLFYSPCHSYTRSFEFRASSTIIISCFGYKAGHLYDQPNSIFFFCGTH